MQQVEICTVCRLLSLKVVTGAADYCCFAATSNEVDRVSVLIDVNFDMIKERDKSYINPVSLDI